MERDTAKAFKLVEMLYILFGVDHRTGTITGVENYIRATEWGKDLP